FYQGISVYQGIFSVLPIFSFLSKNLHIPLLVENTYIFLGFVKLLVFVIIQFFRRYPAVFSFDITVKKPEYLGLGIIKAPFSRIEFIAILGSYIGDPIGFRNPGDRIVEKHIGFQRIIWIDQDNIVSKSDFIQ